MHFINLASEGSGSIKYKISKFPDGQQSIEILNENGYGGLAITPLEEVTIKSRLNSFLDLELIICATKALKNLGFERIHLVTPYFLGGRSDRAFSEDGINYLKDVICPIINSQGYKSVTVLDPHSDVLEACINNFKKIPNYILVKFAINDWLIGDSLDLSEKKIDYSKIRIISPDAGALKKIHSVCENIGYDQEVIIASKHRDLKTGKITSTIVPIRVHDVDKDIFIIDDVCDGGRTFIEIAKAIKMVRSISSAVHPENYGKIYLIVTHGIFSAGLKPLNEHFDGIYTTNSYSSIEDPQFLERNKGEISKIRQLNII
jgi:ribose-phosphate pyrophosphokinase